MPYLYLKTLFNNIDNVLHRWVVHILYESSVYSEPSKSTYSFCSKTKPLVIRCVYTTLVHTLSHLRQCVHISTHFLRYILKKTSVSKHRWINEWKLVIILSCWKSTQKGWITIETYQFCLKTVLFEHHNTVQLKSLGLISIFISALVLWYYCDCYNSEYGEA